MQLRQKRIDFKQKLRKSFRKALADSFPQTFQLFQQQVVESISTSLSNEIPQDFTAAYNALSPGTIRFYKSVAADMVGKERDKYPFLSFPLDEEDNEAIDEQHNGGPTMGGIGEEIDGAEAEEGDEGLEGHVNELLDGKKRKHTPTDGTEPKKPKKPRTK